jgi:nitrogen fixation protein NifU and related proteins
MSHALYPPLVVEHDRAPRNHGPLPAATHRATRDNPLCGDVVTLHAQLVEDRLVTVRFEGQGCAVCRAAASLLTVHVTGLERATAAAIAVAFERFLTAAIPPTDDERARLGDLAVFEPLRTVRARRGCATLAVSALAAALDVR